MDIDQILIGSITYFIALVLIVILIYSMVICLSVKMSKFLPIKFDHELLSLKAEAEQKTEERVALLNAIFINFWKKHKGYFIFFAFIIFHASVGLALNCGSGHSYSCYSEGITLEQKLSIVKFDFNDITLGAEIFLFLNFMLKIVGTFSFNSRNIIARGLVETLVFIILINFLSIMCVSYCNMMTSSLIILHADLHFFIYMMGITVAWWIGVKSRPILYRLGIRNPLDVIILGLSTVPFIWLYYFTMEHLK